MAHFFICYSQTDQSFARKLRRSIRQLDDAHVFLDRYDLAAGSTLKTSLSRQIEACDHFIPILTKASLKSPWVNFEMAEARKCERKTGERKIYAIQHGNDAGKLPKFLARNLVLRFSGPDAFPSDFHRLMQGINQQHAYFSIKVDVRHDPEGGYLFSLKLVGSAAFLNLVQAVEYRLDIDFEDSEENSDLLEGGTTLYVDDRKSAFAAKNVWTDESCTVFVVVYLKTTRELHFIVPVIVGRSAG